MDKRLLMIYIYPERSPVFCPYDQKSWEETGRFHFNGCYIPSPDFEYLVLLQFGNGSWLRIHIRAEEFIHEEIGELHLFGTRCIQIRIMDNEETAIRGIYPISSGSGSDCPGNCSRESFTGNLEDDAWDPTYVIFCILIIAGSQFLELPAYDKRLDCGNGVSGCIVDRSSLTPDLHGFSTNRDFLYIPAETIPFSGNRRQQGRINTSWIKDKIDQHRSCFAIDRERIGITALPDHCPGVDPG